jgi:hypothetical protein
MIEIGSVTTTWRVYWRRNFRLFALAMPGLVTACPEPDATTSDASAKTVARSVLKVKTALHRTLVENSVAVTSVSQHGIIFGANDSGHEPMLFAFDSLGRHRGAWHLTGARNRDWEAASLGPCAPADGGPYCLYLGDVGDNDARRSTVTIYRVLEPLVPPAAPDSVIPVPVLDRLDFRYADRPHDVEAMYVALDGSVFLVTKRRLLDASGRARPALLFRIPPQAWDSSGVVTARLVDSLPIVPGQAQGRQVTDAALSPDGTLLAVRTYAEIFVFAMDSASGLPVAGQSPRPCSVRALDEEQGEGIGWWWDRRWLLLTSEGRREPLHVVECALPWPGR